MLSNPDRALHAAVRKAQSGDMAAGFRILEELLGKDPYFLSARGHRAWWRLCQGEYDLAIEDLGVILQMRPDDDTAHAPMGDCYLRSQRMDEALPCYQRAIQLNPKNRTALMGM